MRIGYTATHKFNPSTNRVWQGYDLLWESYLACSKIKHFTEVVTLEQILGERILEVDNKVDADYLDWDSSIFGLYKNLEYLLEKLKDIDPTTYNLLAVTEEPASPCEKVRLEGFDFMGYDLMDVYGAVSTLTNTGGYFYIKEPNDINNYGLIKNYHRAFDIRAEIKIEYPDESHTDCRVWAIWRMTDKKKVN